MEVGSSPAAVSDQEKRAPGGSFFLVRATGLEPARFWQWNLNPPSLPIPPCPHISAENGKCKAEYRFSVLRGHHAFAFYHTRFALSTNRGYKYWGDTKRQVLRGYVFFHQLGLTRFCFRRGSGAVPSRKSADTLYRRHRATRCRRGISLAPLS